MKDVIAEMDRLKREKEPKQNASSALLNYDIPFLSACGE
jgi:hypothetical protein